MLNGTSIVSSAVRDAHLLLRAATHLCSQSILVWGDDNLMFGGLIIDYRLRSFMSGEFINLDTAFRRVVIYEGYTLEIISASSRVSMATLFYFYLFIFSLRPFPFHVGIVVLPITL